MLLRSLLLLGVLAAGYGYFTLLVADAGTRLAHLGLFCSVFTISMYLSPLADLVRGAGPQRGEAAAGRCGAAQQQPDTRFGRRRSSAASRRAASPSP